MKKLFFLFLVLFSKFYSQRDDSIMIKKISDYYLSESKCYENLRELTTVAGPRLSGSSVAAKSVEWTFNTMKKMGADTVFLQPCKVPHWVRGSKESCSVFSIKKQKRISLDICALGFSIATPVSGLKAKVVVVSSFEDLEKLGEEKVRGKVVYYNVAFNPKNIRTGTSYGETVKYRWDGAYRASKLGAVGVIVRSMSSVNDDLPHTGTMRLDTNGRQIPACAISLNDGDALAVLLNQDPDAEVLLKMNCKLLPDVDSYNVIGEIRGSELPEEIILAGGHLDAWDLGTGAHDDGAGIVHTVELLRLFKQLGYKPKRTIRVVAFMNEENGGRGGDAYAAASLKNQWKHIAALESDAGGFTPRSFGMSAKSEAELIVAKKWSPLLFPLGIMAIHEGGGGADIDDLKSQGVNLFSYNPDSQRYFDLHHTANDKFEYVNKRELELGAACIGSLIYLIDKYGF